MDFIGTLPDQHGRTAIVTGANTGLGYQTTRMLAAKGAKDGDYFGPTGFRELKGKPGPAKSEPHAHDEAVAAKLWETSQELVGYSYL